MLTRSSSETNLLKMNAAGEGPGGNIGMFNKNEFQNKDKTFPLIATHSAPQLQTHSLFNRSELIQRQHDQANMARSLHEPNTYESTDFYENQRYSHLHAPNLNKGYQLNSPPSKSYP